VRSLGWTSRKTPSPSRWHKLLLPSWSVLTEIKLSPNANGDGSVISNSARSRRVRLSNFVSRMNIFHFRSHLVSPRPRVWSLGTKLVSAMLRRVEAKTPLCFHLDAFHRIWCLIGGAVVVSGCNPFRCSVIQSEAADVSCRHSAVEWHGGSHEV